MQLRLVTVAFDPVRGEFPPEPLAGVEGEVLSVVEHFFQSGGVPHLLLVVHHRELLDEVRDRREKRRGRTRANPAEELGPEALGMYEKLRAWRRSRADAEGVPVYVVLNNRQLASIARLRPSSLGELQAIEGIGAKKADRFGRELLAVVRSGVEPAGNGTGEPTMERR